MLRVMACGMLVVGLSGCFRTSVRTGAPRDGSPVTRTGASLFFGLTMPPVTASECHHGVSRVDVFSPWWGALVTVATVGLVMPLRTEYVCAEMPQSVSAEPQVPASIAPL